MEYRVIGLNLARRTDRWKLFYDWHLGLGIPPDWIERWDARDGMDWKRDGWKEGNLYPELIDAASEATGGEAFLSNDMRYDHFQHGICNYCWEWSFIEGIQHIANRERDKLYIFIQDDYQLIPNHKQIQHVVNKIDWDIPDFRLMQLSYLGGSEFRGTRIIKDFHQPEDFTAWTIHKNVRFLDEDKDGCHGLTDDGYAWGDNATLMTPEGAQFIIETSRRTKGDWWVAHIFIELARSREPGLYQAYPIWARHNSPLGQDRDLF